jgi:hypothetical protein
MIPGYEDDDIWMMVEDELQTLAQSFTAHLHHAEYKRLVKKAREAPPRQIPQPDSPMPKETKQKLLRQARDKSNNDTLLQMVSKGKTELLADDAEEEKVDDPWRGTALAGLVASGSQQKTSLKGLDKMPSTTRAALGFSKALSQLQPRQTDAIDLLTRPTNFRQDLGSSTANTENGQFTNSYGDLHGDKGKKHQSKPGQPLEMDSSSHTQHIHTSTKSSSNGMSRDHINPTPVPKSDMAMKAQRPTFLDKRKKRIKEEIKADRLADVPMFLI